MTFNQILKQIKAKDFSPIYYLHGVESYFIDKIATALNEDGVVLNASEKAFNREIFYGPESTASKVVNACRSFPVMAAKRLVILKEAHRMNKNELDKLTAYLEQPVPSTVLVLVFKGRNAGLPKKAAKAAEKAGTVFHAKKMYEQDVQQWVNQYLTDSPFEFDPGVPGILVTNLGTNINLIENELSKMFIFLQATKQTHLKLDFVYQMINVDKEFNIFELINALGKRDQFRSNMIIDRLSQNPKLNPPVLTVGGLFRFFHNLALIKRFQLRDANSVKHKLGVNYYAAKDYLTASNKFDLGKIYRNIGYIHDADLQLKGMIPSNMDNSHVLKTLVWKLLNA